MALEERLQELILRSYDNPYADKLCKCGKGFCLVSCRYDGCFRYPISCESCYVKEHYRNPFHWALVWLPDKAIWVQRDFSQLCGGSAIQLEHHDGLPCSGTKNDTGFIITHTNGVHDTRVRFCGCLDAPDHIEQLMNASLFPATTLDHKSAFTHAVLKQFHMHNLQSKCGAYDYIYSLRRLTDNVTTVKVPVSHFQLVYTILTVFRTHTKHF